MKDVSRLWLALAAMLLPYSAPGADLFYLGSWKVTSAAVAPWWPYVEPNARNSKPDPSETKLLVGRVIVIGAKGITGPRPVGCSGPHYLVKDQPAEGLFQGMFGEMHEYDKSVDPRKVAASVGFRGSSWKTLETGCANELDYHFPDLNHAAFGMNNYIYMLQRQRDGPCETNHGRIGPWELSRRGFESMEECKAASIRGCLVIGKAAT